MPAVLLDVDGTLVVTKSHHALAWWRAFRQHGIRLPVCASTGMSRWAGIS